MKKLFLLALLPFLLTGFSTPSLLGKETITASKSSETSIQSKEEFSAALLSKFQLIKIRTTQLKAMNRCFFQVSEKVLEAEKKGHPLTKTEAMELAHSYGLSEASDIDPLLKEVKSDRFIGNRIQNLLQLIQKREQREIDSEFQKLEKEVRADIEMAKLHRIDISRFRKDMEEYAKSRIESLMWVAIFTPHTHPE